MLTVRHIELVDGIEREVWAVQVPQAVEANGAEAIDAYVAAERAKAAANAVVAPAAEPSDSLAEDEPQ